MAILSTIRSNIDFTLSLAFNRSLRGMDVHHYQNTCVRIQDHIFDYVDLVPVQAGFASLYSLLFILGVVANCATLRCLISFGTKLTGGGGVGGVTNGTGGGSTSGKRGVKFGVSREFLISLTLADLVLIGCTSLPLTAVHIFTRRWLLGEYACRFGPLLQGVGCFVTSFSLTAIAIERYSMVTGKRKEAGPKTRACVVASIWVLAIAASAPLASAYRLRRECLAEIGCFCGEFCDEVGWNSERSRTIYGTAAVLLQYVLPACVLAFCYFKVRQRVERSVTKRLQREHVSLISQQRLSQRKTRTSCMTLLLFAGFACPWLPMCIMNLLRDYSHLPDDWYAVAFASGHLIAMTSILWNPLVYCWANRNFRSAFTAALFCGHRPDPSASELNYEGDDRYYVETATAGVSIPTTNVSVFERSFKKSRSNSSRSARSSSHSGSRRSRLGTASSLGRPHYQRPRPSSWQHDAGPAMLRVPSPNGGSVSVIGVDSSVAESDPVAM